jgi:hypothetical protein
MLRLFVNVYIDPHPERAAELAQCLERNIDHRLIDDVIKLEGRPTFREFFSRVNGVADDSDISIIANSDIFFDETLKYVEALARGECYALSRWDVANDGRVNLYDKADSQDTWIFRGSIYPVAVESANFTMGLPGCDNRLAQILAEAGYQVSNPSRTIRTNHLHLSGVKHYSWNDYRVPGPYLLVPPVALRVPPVALRTGGRRILHIALIVPGSPQEGLRQALRSMAEDYYELDWCSYERNGHLDELRYEFVRLLKEFDPTLIFAQIQTAGVLSSDEVRQARCPFILWSRDLRNDTPSWMFELAPHVIFCFSNLRDVEELKARGYRAEYLQAGIPSDVFVPDGPRRPQTPEIVFMGSNHGWFPLSSQRVEMVALLSRRYGKRFGQYGTNWSSAVSWLNETEEASAYRECRIAINQNHYGDVSRFTSDRLFRAMACGAFAISNHYPGIEFEFKPHTHLVTWHDFDELIRHIDYYLDHDDERKEIATAGCAHVQANHTWGARMRDLEEILELHVNKWWATLDGHVKQVYCQTGEDGVLQRIFDCIGTTNRFLVDIGAGDGVALSNTRALLDQGWSGLLFDRKSTGCNDVISAHITAENVNNILAMHSAPAEFDLLSLDIDGIDYWVWHAIRHRPRVVVIEFNGTIPESESRTIPYDPGFQWDGSDYYGASLAALAGLGQSKGYTLVHQLHSLNAFFVRSDLLNADVYPVVRYTPYQYHAKDPSRRPWQAVLDHARAFNCDKFAAGEVANLCHLYNVATIIEGGTYKGDTTPYLATLADRVYTIEIDAQLWPESKHLDAIPNVTRIKGSCPVELEKLLPSITQPVLYFADSHWGHPTPLPDELRAFANCGIRPILMVHDFQNPYRAEFGYDTYEGQPYEWSWIRPYIEAIYGNSYRHYFNMVANGARRGILYVVPTE